MILRLLVLGVGALSVVAAVRLGLNWSIVLDEIKLSDDLMEKSEKIKGALVDEVVSPECRELLDQILTERVDRNS